MLSDRHFRFDFEAIYDRKSDTLGFQFCQVIFPGIRFVNSNFRRFADRSLIFTNSLAIFWISIRIRSIGEFPIRKGANEEISSRSLIFTFWNNYSFEFCSICLKINIILVRLAIVRSGFYAGRSDLSQMRNRQFLGKFRAV